MKKRLLMVMLILSTTMTGCGGCRATADEVAQDIEVAISTETEALKDIVADAQDTEELETKTSEATGVTEEAEKTETTENSTKPAEVADNKTSTTDKSSPTNTKPNNSNDNSSSKNETTQAGGSTDNGSSNDTGLSSSESNTDVAVQPQPETPVESEVPSEPETPAEPVNPKNPNGYQEITWEEYLVYTSHDTWTPGSYYIVDTDQTVHIQEPIDMGMTDSPGGTITPPEPEPWNPNGYPEVTEEEYMSGTLAPGIYWVVSDWGTGDAVLVEP